MTDDPGGRTPDSLADLAGEITAAWNAREEPGALTADVAKRVEEAIDRLDRGEARVAEVVDGQVVVHEWLKLAILLCFRLRGLEKPVIAAINGVTMGAGLGVALASDIRIAGESASLVLSPVSIGFIPAVGSSALLPALIGLGLASELAFSGERGALAEHG